MIHHPLIRRTSMRIESGQCIETTGQHGHEVFRSLIRSRAVNCRSTCRHRSLLTTDHRVYRGLHLCCSQAQRVNTSYSSPADIFQLAQVSDCKLPSSVSNIFHITMGLAECTVTPQLVSKFGEEILKLSDCRNPSGTHAWFVLQHFRRRSHRCRLSSASPTNSHISKHGLIKTAHANLSYSGKLTPWWTLLLQASIVTSASGETTQQAILSAGTHAFGLQMLLKHQALLGPAIYSFVRHAEWRLSTQ